MNFKYLLILLICIVSRVLTSIYYIEDIDSLRFALSNENFDVINNQPHFPGYPLFCFLSKIFFSISNSSAISFSIIGGFAVFLIYYYTHKILSLFGIEKIHWAVFFIIFSHPFLWVMSNRYMPDVLGLAILIAGVYFLIISIRNYNLNHAIILFFIIGLESGVRLSYVPFFIPATYILFKYKRNLIKLLLSFGFSISIWLFPFVIDTGWDNIFDIGFRNTSGHFFEWGGTIASSTDSYIIRFLGLIRAIIAEVFSSWWPGRSLFTLSMSLFSITATVYFFFSKKLNILRDNSKLIMLLCVLVYGIWIFYFQNIVYKPRHILPFLPFWFLIITYFYTNIKIKYRSFAVVFISIFLMFQSFICYRLVNSHLSPTSISQTKDWIKSNSGDDLVVCADGLFSFYYKKHSELNNLIFISSENKVDLVNEFNNGKKICSYMNLDNILGEEPNNIVQFYHNPSSNRLWSHLILRVYEK